MKKIVSFFTFALIGLLSFANPITTEDVNPSELENTISIEVTYDNQKTESIEFNFDSKEELINFDIEKGLKTFSLDQSKEIECTASISVTVSLGVDSNFVSVTVTIEGIPCADIISEIKKLRAEIQDAL